MELQQQAQLHQQTLNQNDQAHQQKLAQAIQMAAMKNRSQ
jgi:hypothetical protein